MKVKLFSDGADPKTLLSLAKNPDVAGFTTNPSLMKAAGITDYKGFCKSILSEIRNKPISFEVFADDFETMKKQAFEIASWAENVYVKIPITNSEGESSTPLISELSHKNIKINVTAIFDLEQTLQACSALKGGAASVVSVFAGRIADSGRDPMPIMKASLAICRNFDKKIELLWASTRELYNIIQADEMGCDIITVPPNLLTKTNTFHKDLKAFSLETVKQFKADSIAAGFSL